MNLEHTKYLISSIATGLAFLHSKDILYRGLVPEAVCLTTQGQVQLFDFRFAKAELGDDEKTFTICGTPEYMSPEQVTTFGHGYEADFWSTGILAFEAITGKTPFGGEGKNEMAVYSAIGSFMGELPFPEDVDLSAKDFISMVLQPRVEERLVDHLNMHAFLKDVYLEAVSPFKAEVEALVAKRGDLAKANAVF